MKIIKSDVKILTPIDGHDTLRHIEQCGRTAYKSEDKITDSSAEKFVANIIKRGHESVLEHYSFTVRFIVDRGCYDEETKVLTATRGWQYFKNLQEDDKFYSLNDDNEIEVVKAKNFISYPVDEELLHFQSTQIDLKVTSDHRMWVYDYDKRSPKTRIWKFLSADQLNNNRYRFNKSSNGTSNNEQNIITIPGCKYKNNDNLMPEISFDMNKFLWLVGLWITDGSLEYRKDTSTHNGKLIITQIKEKIRNKLEDHLIDLNIPYHKDTKQFYLNCPQLREWLRTNFLQKDNYQKTYYLTLPRWIFNLGKNNLSSLLEGITDGDGTPITNSTGYQIYTASHSFAEDLLELSLLLGKAANIRVVKPRLREFPNGATTFCKEQFVVSIHDKVIHLFDKRTAKITREYYKGNVYCVELEKNHRLFVQRNGKSVWCGNCSHEIVRHRLAAYTQESTRYCNYSGDKFGNEITVIEPCFMEDKTYSQRDLWVSSCEQAERFYFLMLSNGFTPQEARAVLPNSLKTEVVMTANLREWRHFFKLRCDKAAHPQMREVAIKLLHMCQDKIPVVFDDITY